MGKKSRRGQSKAGSKRSEEDMDRKPAAVAAPEVEMDRKPAAVASPAVVGAPEPVAAPAVVAPASEAASTDDDVDNTSGSEHTGSDDQWPAGIRGPYRDFVWNIIRQHAKEQNQNRNPTFESVLHEALNRDAMPQEEVDELDRRMEEDMGISMGDMSLEELSGFVNGMMKETFGVDDEMIEEVFGAKDINPNSGVRPLDNRDPAETVDAEEGFS